MKVRLVYEKALWLIIAEPAPGVNTLVHLILKPERTLRTVLDACWIKGMFENACSCIFAHEKREWRNGEFGGKMLSFI